MMEADATLERTAAADDSTMAEPNLDGRTMKMGHGKSFSALEPHGCTDTGDVTDNQVEPMYKGPEEKAGLFVVFLVV
ncbi:hypothetical protein SPRG_11975 [Saprolegnia parasitica CBS 223.65]|uniref:Uncharacterized protein n=1 Tax=Saprolegnia parasitica (strain CBS 223.65) TaxID=695850 RepID=A0A067BX46_SAPPC|nr:hypothetical protein SPRG_11975 [Saprolegnia parasitica CBS 223.65]KDO22838.1 hypothetical protein SPRG_11975 [Saprolegnia parasitica CBS 223.65]|eukprot:XP_012206396.1 hypothetical protein SPRG_11975 [Saprolegnia parasitica CBS 223.65]